MSELHQLHKYSIDSLEYLKHVEIKYGHLLGRITSLPVKVVPVVLE